MEDIPDYQDRKEGETLEETRKRMQENDRNFKLFLAKFTAITTKAYEEAGFIEKVKP